MNKGLVRLLVVEETKAARDAKSDFRKCVFPRVQPVVRSLQKLREASARAVLEHEAELVAAVFPVFVRVDNGTRYIRLLHRYFNGLHF